jgi:hypothetical protein
VEGKFPVDAAHVCFIVTISDRFNIPIGFRITVEPAEQSSIRTAFRTRPIHSVETAAEVLWIEQLRRLLLKLVGSLPEQDVSRPHLEGIEVIARTCPFRGDSVTGFRELLLQERACGPIVVTVEDLGILL